MSSPTAAMLASVAEVKTALQLVQTVLALTNWQYPETCTMTNGSSFDYLIVGCGTSGSILANRLSSDSSITVGVFEAGGYAPLESDLPGLFPLVPESQYDYGFIAEDDGYSAQNLVNKAVKLAQGKMVGGSSALNHLLWTQSNDYDFERWVNITGDSSWNYDTMSKYLRKAEKLLDASILESSNAKYHGTDGFLTITKHTDPVNSKYLEALKELGNEIREDLSGESSLGYSELLVTIANGTRSNTALRYLGATKSRSNLCISTYSTVKKIIITNGVATGVEMVDSNGDTYVVYANKEVIVSAGVFNSPKLLWLSGIGPKAALEELGTPVVSDLPVGENMQDHSGCVLVYQMEASTATVPASNYHLFPVPGHIGYRTLSSGQTYPDYQAIGLVFPHDVAAQMQINSIVFSYINDICDKFYAASAGRTTYVVALDLPYPKSRGKVVMPSNDYRDDPKIYMGTFTDSADLTTMAQNLKDFNQITETQYFTSVNATLVDVGLCSSSSSDFWECYALAMSSSMNHYVGTCSMGSVLDSNLRVIGVDRMRVVDASAIPAITGNEVMGSVIALTEKAADLILADYY